MNDIRKRSLFPIEGPEEGFTEACRICNKEDRIVVCGSFFTVSAVWPLAEKFLKETIKGE